MVGRQIGESANYIQFMERLINGPSILSLARLHNEATEPLNHSEPIKFIIRLYCIAKQQIILSIFSFCISCNSRTMIATLHYKHFPSRLLLLNVSFIRFGYLICMFVCLF